MLLRDFAPKCHSSFRGGHSGCKNKIWGFSTTAISNFGVSNRNSIGITEINFEVFEIKFWTQKTKIVI